MTNNFSFLTHGGQQKGFQGGKAATLNEVVMGVHFSRLLGNGQSVVRIPVGSGAEPQPKITGAFLVTQKTSGQVLMKI